MFLGFFNLLRSYGLKVSMQEWMSLMQALEMDLGNSTLTGFYHLCRCILVKSEADYDTLDKVFALYFKNIKEFEELPEDVWKWLADGEIERMLDDIPDIDFDDIGIAELLKMFQERLAEQNEAHHGGNRWIGTGGTSPFGRGGYNPKGIRIGGESRHRSAVKVAGDRRFLDFREDHELDSRDFQVAFRRLRQYSSRVDAQRTELDVEGTVKATGDNAGLLSLVYEKPRKNTVKVLLLMDSDGSMRRYSDLCNTLFQALRKSNHFKDLQVYFFHNCIYDHVYKDPTCTYGNWVETQWLMKKFDSEYKVIFVGDGAMAPYELLTVGGINDMRLFNNEPGIEWLRKLDRKFSKKIWLNPIPKKRWNYAWGSYTINVIRDEFDMFELSLSGLEEGIKKLLVR
ncbi:MAG TPA: VWA domain-containing protein [Candidatus Eubacterium pullicola]|nr:VWA domain-containing protein [Candidatus Eubacterium pullicola]